MKRLPWLRLAVVALLAGCTEQQLFAPPAGLAGAFDLVRSGDLLFVTSAGRDELRVIDLNTDPDRRGFMRAPNPLQPLAIPVLERPQGLVGDVGYVEREFKVGDESHPEVREVSGRYVYVRSAGAQEISVVAADRSLLREVLRLPTAGPVTAMAARAPADWNPDEPQNSTQPSFLYYAVKTKAGGQVWRVALPPPSTLSITPVQSLRPEPVIQAPDEAVVSLLILPQPGQIAVATRGPQGGRTFRLDEQTKLTIPLAFSGPVRLLATHGQAIEIELDAEKKPVRPITRLEAGARIFALLDESACKEGADCTGVQAVESSTGQLAADFSGKPMLTLTYGPGLPTGLALSSRAKANVPSANREVRTYSLLGTIPLSNGGVLLFDGYRLQLFDTNANQVQASVRRFRSGEETTSQILATAMEGVSNDSSYEVTYQRVLTAPLERDLDQPWSFLLPADRVIDAVREIVQPQDLIVLLSQEGQSPCPDLQVARVEPLVGGQGDVMLHVVPPEPPLPPECATLPRFLVRAGGQKPYVIVELGVGLRKERLGEGPANAVQLEGRYLFRPAPEPPANTPLLALALQVDRPEADRARDDRHVVTVRSNFQPYGFSPASTVSLSRYRVPGSVVPARVGDTDLAYIAYPSADGVLQVNLEGQLEVQRGMTPFE